MRIRLLKCILTYALQQSPDHYRIPLKTLLQPFQIIGGVAESVSLHISKPQIVVIESYGCTEY